MTEATRKLTKKDFVSDQQVRWCPGCGDYAVLNATQQAFAEIGMPPEKVVIVSGIGCAARFPYYLNTYGFHTIHGRAPAIATGLKLARPDLSIWVVGGDGDMLSIGGNHLLHALRRNVDLKILCFNNRIYGLTKGQASPTSEMGKVTYSTPLGLLDRPVNPISIALAAEATFVARTVDIFNDHLKSILHRAAAHEGSAFVEILQNCVIFNDGTWEGVTAKETRAEQTLMLEHGKPLLFGKDKNRGVRLNRSECEVVTVGENGITEEDLLVHDENFEALSYLISRLDPSRFPTPLGVFRSTPSTPYEQGVHAQIEQAREAKGEGDLLNLIHSGDTWEVRS
ncbi:MAG: 2-oxoacid:ferredoxin oxidoreductase subunit beta [Planctomycetota bacterium]|jgi:2-oxoglutarate ferredoxin oxidoreductase subunit beta